MSSHSPPLLRRVQISFVVLFAAVSITAVTAVSNEALASTQDEPAATHSASPTSSPSVFERLRGPLGLALAILVGGGMIIALLSIRRTTEQAIHVLADEPLPKRVPIERPTVLPAHPTQVSQRVGRGTGPETVHVKAGGEWPIAQGSVDEPLMEPVEPQPPMASRRPGSELPRRPRASTAPPPGGRYRASSPELFPGVEPSYPTAPPGFDPHDPYKALRDKD